MRPSLRPPIFESARTGPALDAYDRAHHRRMRVVAESCDQVLDATDPVAVRIEYRSVQERGEMEDFSHVMPLRSLKATPNRQLSPEKASVTCGRTVRERKTIQRNVGLKRASTSATKVTSSSPTPACVTKRARRGPTVPRRRQGSRVLDQLSRLRVVEGHDVSCDTSRGRTRLGNVVAKSPARIRARA